MNVGYRYYDKHPQQVWFPFGHGLSYTQFEYSDIAVSADKISSEKFELTVSCNVTNIGEMPGKEVVQLYCAPIDSIVARPQKQLCGFEKISLRPKETKRVAFRLTNQDFAYYNTCLHDWHVESGVYHILIGASSVDIKLKKAVSVMYHGDYTKERFDGSMVL